MILSVFPVSRPLFDSGFSTNTARGLPLSLQPTDFQRILLCDVPQAIHRIHGTLYLPTFQKKLTVDFCWTSNVTNHPLTKYLQKTHSLSTLSDVPHGPSFTMKMSWKRTMMMNWKRLHVWFSSTSLAA